MRLVARENPGARIWAVMKKQQDVITIGVPVYRGEETVGEALGSIQRQTYRNLEVVISIDGADDRSAERCRPFLADSRFRMEIQRDHLGWAGNLNTLMSRCRGEFFLYHAQDDHISDDFISALHKAALARPRASICYSAMQMFGIDGALIETPSIIGSAFTRPLRQIELLESRPFLGLIRTRALQATNCLKIYSPESFAADIALTAELAVQGDLILVPGPTYNKRMTGRNTHLKWNAWSAECKRIAWAAFGAALVESVVPSGRTKNQRHELFCAVFERLMSSRGGRRWIFADVDSLTACKRRRFIEDLLALVESRRVVDLAAVMGQSWKALAEIAAAHCGRDDEPVWQS